MMDNVYVHCSTDFSAFSFMEPQSIVRINPGGDIKPWRMVIDIGKNGDLQKLAWHGWFTDVV